jgi:hypothetical protein
MGIKAESHDSNDYDEYFHHDLFYLPFSGGLTALT